MNRFEGAKERRVRRADTGAAWRRVTAAPDATRRSFAVMPLRRVDEGVADEVPSAVYARLRRTEARVRPGRWTREVDSEHLEALLGASSPTEQAYAILDHRIPYRAVIAALEQLPPAVMVALVEVMSARELLLNLGSLRRRGALAHPLVGPLVERKLGAAGLPGLKDGETRRGEEGGPAG